MAGLSYGDGSKGGRPLIPCRCSKRRSCRPGAIFGKKSSIRARVGRVFALQKNRFGLFIRTIGLARAETKPSLANLACNFDRLIFHERQRANGMSASWKR